MLLLSLALLFQPSPIIEVQAKDSCGSAADDERDIIICAAPNNGSAYRVGPDIADEASSLPKAKIDLSEDVSLSAEAESVEVGGAQSDRAMIRLKIRF